MSTATTSIRQKANQFRTSRLKSTPSKDEDEVSDYDDGNKRMFRWQRHSTGGAPQSVSSHISPQQHKREMSWDQLMEDDEWLRTGNQPFGYIESPRQYNSTRSRYSTGKIKNRTESTHISKLSMPTSSSTTTQKITDAKKKLNLNPSDIDDDDGRKSDISYHESNKAERRFSLQNLRSSPRVGNHSPKSNNGDGKSNAKKSPQYASKKVAPKVGLKIKSLFASRASNENNPNPPTLTKGSDNDNNMTTKSPARKSNVSELQSKLIFKNEGTKKIQKKNDIFTRKQTGTHSPVGSTATSTSTNYVGWPGTLDKQGNTLAIPSSFSASDDDLSSYIQESHNNEAEGADEQENDRTPPVIQNSGNSNKSRTNNVNDKVTRINNNIPTTNPIHLNRTNSVHKERLSWINQTFSNDAEDAKHDRGGNDKKSTYENAKNVHLNQTKNLNNKAIKTNNKTTNNNPIHLNNTNSVHKERTSWINKTSSNDAEGKDKRGNDRKSSSNNDPGKFHLNRNNDKNEEMIRTNNTSVPITNPIHINRINAIGNEKVQRNHNAHASNPLQSWQAKLSDLRKENNIHLIQKNPINKKSQELPNVEKEPNFATIPTNNLSSHAPWEQKSRQGVNGNYDHSSGASASASSSSRTSLSPKGKIDTSASLNRVHSAGKSVASSSNENRLNISVSEFSDPQFPMDSTVTLSEAALRSRDILALGINGATPCMKGFSGFLDKTRDVPNLMDDEDTVTTASTFQSKRVQNQNVAQLQQKKEDMDSQSDVFDGLSSVAGYPKQTRNIQLNQPPKKNEVQKWISSKSQDRVETSAEKYNFVKIGNSLSSIQATPESTGIKKPRGERENKVKSTAHSDCSSGHSPKKGFLRKLDAHLSKSNALSQHFLKSDRSQSTSQKGDTRSRVSSSSKISGTSRKSSSSRISGASRKSSSSKISGTISRVSFKSKVSAITNYSSDGSSYSYDYDDSDYSDEDLSEYIVDPDQVQKLVRVYRKITRRLERKGYYEEDSKKAFALFEMRSRVMESDIERGLERWGGTVVVDDIVTTPSNQASHRVRDAMIVSKAWRDGANPSDAFTAFSLTQDPDTVYHIKRESSYNASSYISFTNTDDNLYSNSSYQKVSWVDDTDFTLLKCPSLGPRSMRGSEMFTVGDCQSMLLKLTNEQCVQLRTELDEVTAELLEAETKMEEEKLSSNGNGPNTSTDAEINYLMVLEDQEIISKSLVQAEKAFCMVREQIERLVRKYEILLERIGNDDESIYSVDSDGMIDDEDYCSESLGSNECESDGDNSEERRRLARRAQKAELKAEVAAREAALAKLEMEKTKKEAEKIREEKERELDNLKQQLEDLEAKSQFIATEYEMRLTSQKLLQSRSIIDVEQSVTSPTSHPGAQRLVQSISSPPSRQPLSESQPQPQSQSQPQSQPEPQASTTEKHDWSKVDAKERAKAKFRIRSAEKINEHHRRRRPRSRSVKRNNDNNKNDNNNNNNVKNGMMMVVGSNSNNPNNLNQDTSTKTALTGRVSQRLEFYERSLNAVKSRI
eukprot:CAMPEP_0184874408 /NCGR_PEP_ID=MMETSP0580-20130426/42381_1 /TAXON_ID=1118495 /ORGANISM="Dactyliosolen fragilissimus" /LENGTH=1530 /DNA_ID=CAMNT_0027377423 /DNA_START=128 /DNA_END=4720 /DNA_ORIENTATION=-